MSEQKESSVLFSLKELMSLEEDRIRSEEAEKAAAFAAAQKAKAEAERAAREAEESRIRAESERRRMEEQRTREDAARVEAIRVAEIEKARMEAEQRARIEAMAAQQSHERSLAALREDKGKKTLRSLLIGGSAVVAVGVLVTGYMVYQTQQQNQARIAAAAAERAEAEAAAAAARARADESQRKIDSLLMQLANANDQATRLSLQKALQDEQDKVKKSVPGGARGPVAPKGGSAKPACAPGDPLCSNL
jgi:colicin import membrane protein